MPAPRGWWWSWCGTAPWCRTCRCWATRTSAVKRSIGSTTGCTITEKAPTRAFSWLKAPTSVFTFKTLLRHYAKRALTARSLNVKLGPQRNYHECLKCESGCSCFQPGEGPSRDLLRDYITNLRMELFEALDYV